MEVGAGWGIIPGMLFLFFRGCTWGMARISLGCVGFLDNGWAGRVDSLGKRSVSFLNILGSSSSAVACRPRWTRVWFCSLFIYWIKSASIFIASSIGLSMGIVKCWGYRVYWPDIFMPPVAVSINIRHI